MRFTNRHNLPEPVVRALTEDNYSKGGADLSVTQIIDSPRIPLLRAEHEDGVTEDVTDRVWSLFGTAVHNIFENYAEGKYVPEERLYIETQGLTVSGAMDIQYVGEHQKIFDYKVTSAWTLIFGKKAWVDGKVVFLGKQEWENQLNVYAHLRRKGHRKGENEPLGLETDGLRIIVILRDWQQSKADMDPEYPQCQIVPIKINLWSPEEQERYFEERVAIHREARELYESDGILPLCSDAERWPKETKYAVMKKGNKRATRVYSSRVAAEQHAEEDAKFYVEERPGEFSRCEKDFCRVSQWCDQFRYGIEEMK